MDKIERRLRTPEAAAMVGLAPRTLEQLRYLGDGPRYRKSGRIVTYLASDLAKWLKQRERLHASTSDPGVAAQEAR